MSFLRFKAGFENNYNSITYDNYVCTAVAAQIYLFFSSTSLLVDTAECDCELHSVLYIQSGSCLRSAQSKINISKWMLEHTANKYDRQLSVSLKRGAVAWCWSQPQTFVRESKWIKVCINRAITNRKTLVTFMVVPRGMLLTYKAFIGASRASVEKHFPLMKMTKVLDVYSEVLF